MAGRQPATAQRASRRHALRATAYSAAATRAGAALLQIDAGASLLELRVRAAGPLAPLGHAHVLRATQLEGELWLAEPLEHSRLQLRVPVESISVDDPQARAAAGGEFAQPLPEEARRGTREHLLGERQLDAAHFPNILLEAVSLQVAKGDAGTGEGSLALRVTLRDRSTVLAVPVAWEQGAGEQGTRVLRARGQFTLLQSCLLYTSDAADE